MFAALDAEAYDRIYGDRALVRRLLVYFRHRGRALATVVGATIALALLGAAIPVALGRAVGAMAGRVDVTRSAVLVGLVLAAGVATWAFNWLRRRALARLVGDTVLALRRDAFAAALRQDLSFHDRYASGRIVSRITTDTNDLGQTVTLVTDLASQVMQVAVLAFILSRISMRLTLVLLVWAPLVIAMAYAWRSAARHVTRQGNRAMAEVNAAIHEAIAGIAVAKNFRREGAVYEAFDAVNRQSYAINLRRGLVLATVFPALAILAGAGNALLVYFGALSVAAGAIALGEWFLFVQSVEAFFFPLVNLSSFWSQVQSGLSAAERIFALVDAEPSVVQTASEPVGRLQGDIRFEGVHFAYAPDGPPVLRGFDLHVRPGEMVALVGHTGAGKSSIARLVARSYEFQGGRLLVDGRDVRTFDLAEYRRQLGVVPQAPFLFQGTVADNVRYARPDATDAELERLARRIGGGEWLDALPAGLATDVGERGARLSAGERQLVALLRVLAQQPTIFVLDEATASIDPFTETQIQDALELILADATSIVIAHRLSTVRAADRIVVVRAGRIIEEGGHDDLVAAGGHYAELYETYFRHQSPDYRVDDGAPVSGAPTTSWEAT